MKLKQKWKDYHPSRCIRTIQVFLLTLIVIGLGLIATKQLWIPKLINKIVPTQIPQNWETVINQRLGFEISMPENWFIQFDTDVLGQFVQVGSTQEFIHGVGEPASGSWVQITKGTCNNHSDALVPTDVGASQMVLRKTVCKEGFEISLNFWSGDWSGNAQEKAADLQRFDVMIQTFKPLL